MARFSEKIYFDDKMVLTKGIPSQGYHGTDRQDLNRLMVDPWVHKPGRLFISQQPWKGRWRIDTSTSSRFIARCRHVLSFFAT